MTDTIRLEIHADGVALLTFSRPEALNALDMASMRRLADVVATLPANAAIRALILTGASQEAFCSGGDLVDLHSYRTEADARAFTTFMGDALLTIERLPVPVIAAINGYAMGGGSEIAVACDMRIVDEKARLGFVQVRLALIPGWGAGQRLLRLVGYATAMRLLLTGRVLEAEELAALGLADQIVAPGTALEEALAFAHKYIVPNPPEVVRAIKTLLRAGLEQPYTAALLAERNLFPSLWVAEPHLRAVDDFLNRQRTRKDGA